MFCRPRGALVDRRSVYHHLLNPELDQDSLPSAADARVNELELKSFVLRPDEGPAIVFPGKDELKLTGRAFARSVDRKRDLHAPAADEEDKVLEPLGGLPLPVTRQLAVIVLHVCGVTDVHDNKLSVVGGQDPLRVLIEGLASVRGHLVIFDVDLRQPDQSLYNCSSGPNLNSVNDFGVRLPLARRGVGMSRIDE